MKLLIIILFSPQTLPQYENASPPIAESIIIYLLWNKLTHEKVISSMLINGNEVTVNFNHYYHKYNCYHCYHYNNLALSNKFTVFHHNLTSLVFFVPGGT